MCHSVAFFWSSGGRSAKGQMRGSFGVQQPTRFYFMLCILLLFRLPCLPLHLIVRNKASSVCDAKKMQRNIMHPLLLNSHLLGDPPVIPLKCKKLKSSHMTRPACELEDWSLHANLPFPISISYENIIVKLSVGGVNRWCVLCANI